MANAAKQKRRRDYTRLCLCWALKTRAHRLRLWFKNGPQTSRGNLVCSAFVSFCSYWDFWLNFPRCSFGQISNKTLNLSSAGAGTRAAGSPSPGGRSTASPASVQETFQSTNGWFCLGCLILGFSMNHTRCSVVNHIGVSCTLPPSPRSCSGSWQAAEAGSRFLWKAMKGCVVVGAAALCSTPSLAEALCSLPFKLKAI